MTNFQVSRIIFRFRLYADFLELYNSELEDKIEEIYENIYGEENE